MSGRRSSSVAPKSAPSQNENETDRGRAFRESCLGLFESRILKEMADKISTPPSSPANTGNSSPSFPENLDIARESDHTDKPVTAAEYAEVAEDARDHVEHSLGSDQEVSPVLLRRAEILEAGIDPEKLEKISVLLKTGTLEAQMDAIPLLKECGLLAVQRWKAASVEDMHDDPALRHQFSQASRRRVNRFAKVVKQRVLKGLNEDSVVLDLGTGFANDLKYFTLRSRAHGMGVDLNYRAIMAAEKSIRRGGLRGKVDLATQDFFPILEAAQGRGFGLVYSHSTLHYMPHLILRDRTFPLIAGALRSSDRPKTGKLCLAMKIADSASAKSRHQLNLAPDDPYHPSVHLQEKMFRIYPASAEHVLALLEPSFDIEYCRLSNVMGYDKEGELEIFCNIIASPKKV